jgi:hypothetical protein
VETKSLEVLERVAKNLPCFDKLDYTITETQLGDVYVALARGWGVDFPGIAWHGVYAFQYGDDMATARTGEADGELTIEEARRQFIDDAAWFLAQYDKRDMLDPSFKFDNR